MAGVGLAFGKLSKSIGVAVSAASLLGWGAVGRSMCRRHIESSMETLRGNLDQAVAEYRSTGNQIKAFFGDQPVSRNVVSTYLENRLLGDGTSDEKVDRTGQALTNYSVANLKLIEACHKIYLEDGYRTPFNESDKDPLKVFENKFNRDIDPRLQSIRAEVWRLKAHEYEDE